MLRLCECGCGERVTRVGNHFVSGHNVRGINHPMYGRKHSDEARRKMSEAHKGRKREEPGYWLGKKRSPETRRKISNSLMGNQRTLGKKLSEAHKRKLSKANRGARSYLWRGGTSFEPYGLDFTRVLKRAIRERDEFTCQLCGLSEDGRALSCHHIDYDKTNNEPDNLISLCNSGGCHTKTNHNRAFYTKLFGGQLAYRTEPGAWQPVKGAVNI